MKYLDEFRDSERCERLVSQIRERASRRWVLMDVCGGQTHSLIRHGIERRLDDVIELIHGPGCPVCVTPAEVIDFAIALSLRDNLIVTSFGDMLRVPGNNGSMLDARSRGGDVRVVYSPVDALRIAQENPQQDVVFLAVGFETTAPATALAVTQARQLGLSNFSVVPAHVRVQPAMQVIMESPENRVQGFLAAGHVCVITGYASYQTFANRYSVPVVVTGFEPVDLLEGILECVVLMERRECIAVNRYSRGVRTEGNQAAQDLVSRVYRPADRPWRGFGVIAGGGLDLSNDYAEFDAYHRFPESVTRDRESTTDCRGADVMSGKIKPKECAAFGTRCTPDSPLGAPMVSSEGACAAYYRFDPISISVPSKPN